MMLCGWRGGVIHVVWSDVLIGLVENPVLIFNFGEENRPFERFWRPLAVIWVCSFVFATPAGADFQDGVEAYRAGDFEKAIAEWQI